MYPFIAGNSQFERDSIWQRKKEDFKLAWSRGRSGCGRHKLNHTNTEAIHNIYQEKKQDIIEICKMFGMSQPAVYKEIGKTFMCCNIILTMDYRRFFGDLVNEN